MASACASCGGALSRMDALLGRSKCGKCRAAEGAARQQAETRYPGAVRRILAPGAEFTLAQQELEETRKLTGLSDARALTIHKNAFREAALEALADDILSADEEGRLLQAGNAIGITQELLNTELKDLLFRLMVARVNDGRMPTVDSAHVLLKKDEQAHIETNAELIKEVAVREWRGGYSGVSFRVAKGVRYHTGGARGRSVVVGTQMQSADSGILTVTSLRSVFQGSRTSVELPHAKLLSLQVFTDGVQFHMSNRKNPSLFKIESGDVVAAVVNAAVQRLL